MRGRIYDRGPREAARRHWADVLVPAAMALQVRPLMPLLSRREDLVLVDVGANKGCWTKAFLNVFGPRVGHAYCIDPSPENHAELTERGDSLLFEAADVGRISAHPLALSATVGPGVLHADEDGSPLASLYPHDLVGREGLLVLPDVAGPRQVVLDKAIAVRVTTLDAFVRDQGIAHVDVLKIDVVGSELDVLRGAEASLAAGLVDCIMFDFGPHQIEARHFFRDFHSLLRRHDFSMHKLVAGAKRGIGDYQYFYEDFSATTTFVARCRAAPAATPPAHFDEDRYLGANPDVGAAVAAGAFASGFGHWLEYGEFEGRPLGK